METKIGIVGAGDITRKVHLPVLQNMSDVRIEWLYDKDPTRAESMAAAYGVRSIPRFERDEMRAVDVVLLAIPVDFRRSYLVALAESGVAAFCEKPFALTHQEHLDLMRLFDPSRLGCSYMRRFNSSVFLLRKILRAAWFGPLRAVRYREGARSKGSGSDTSFLDDPSLGRSRGILVDLGSHGIDLMLYLLQAKSFEVKSSEMIFDGPVDRRASASIELMLDQHGIVPFEFCVSWLDRQPNLLELEFERACVWCSPNPGAEVFVGPPGIQSQSVRLIDDAPGASTVNQAYYLEWKAFIEGMRGRFESAASAASAAIATALVETIHRRSSGRHD
jgi:predicted dehydrogenase